MNTEKKDIFQRVTDMIVSAIEEGAGSYRMPWRTSGGFPNSPINAASKRPYRGINVLVLWATAQERGYKSGTWATYKQWSELGAQVRKGEKSANVVFWKFFDREEEKRRTAWPVQKPTQRKIPMARDYWVFNAEQVEGYDALAETSEAVQRRANRVGRGILSPSRDRCATGRKPSFLPARNRFDSHAAICRFQGASLLLFRALPRDDALERRRAPAKTRPLRPVWFRILRS